MLHDSPLHKHESYVSLHDEIYFESIELEVIKEGILEG
jgi:hypothetical protein